MTHLYADAFYAAVSPRSGATDITASVLPVTVLVFDVSSSNASCISDRSSTVGWPCRCSCFLPVSIALLPLEEELEEDELDDEPPKKPGFRP